jgi:large subunit ribosomal protein L29
MEAEKIRNLSDTELAQQQREQMDQLFRLKFQMKMGQTESLNKIRGLRRGVARLKTIARERALGLSGPAPAGSAKAAKSAAKVEHKTAPVAKAGAAKTKKKAAKRSAATKASAKSKAAGKKTAKKSGKR